MRTEKELWEVVLKNQKYFTTGLCGWVVRLRTNRIISYEESSGLYQVLIKYAETLGRPEGEYLWPVHEIAPRIEWIKERIKQLENEPKVGQTE